LTVTRPGPSLRPGSLDKAACPSERVARRPPGSAPTSGDAASR